jgi:hypothetical protein
MSAGNSVLTREGAKLLPPRDDALSYDQILAAIQNAPVGELVNVTWSTIQDSTWHDWTGTIQTVLPDKNPSFVGAIRIRFTDVQHDLVLSQSLPHDVKTTSFWFPGTDVYLKSIRVVSEANASPEIVASLIRGRSEQRVHKRVQRDTEIAFAKADAQQAQVRASSEAAAAARATSELQQAATANAALHSEYQRGEGMFFAKQAELQAAMTTIATLQRQVADLQRQQSPSPLVHAHALPVFSPLGAPAARPIPILNPGDVETWPEYLAPARVRELINAISAHYGVNFTAPLNVRRAFDALCHILLLASENTVPLSPSLKQVLEDARVALRTEISRSNRVPVERVAQEMLRQDTKDAPATNDERWMQQVRADAAKARSNVRCHNCGLLGHIAPNCRKPKQGGSKGGPHRE